MDLNQWVDLKARLLAIGTAQVTGEPIDEYVTRSTAGPGAGGRGSLFFSNGSHRVRLSLADASPVQIKHLGEGRVELTIDGEKFSGVLEHPALHCPRQAYITITPSCIFSCRYCNVPVLKGSRKTLEEIESLVESVYGKIDAISLTSGVLESIEEEEAYAVKVVSRLTRFNVPIGVSIYPTLQTPARLKQAGAAEVKFNLEAATPDLFTAMCPGLSFGSIRDILRESVRLFGRGHVFSNIILGLGESDAEMQDCIDSLCQDGVIPVIRPLNPIAELSEFTRPDAARIELIFRYLEAALKKSGLDPSMALTMCPACMGCDMIPGRE
ncbi:radical SAM protein [Methanospirillum lacunae]|uniref:Radical SAM protein n=1 Tax=Methanospirillum lacunae TaxID=668570 RepID=A0A2V2MTB2_9EURY|nr:radical SAM protein [Methanospirillum lacunae]PWR71434.1 radical SAM protein [Methanospirillum lacunae]